MGGALFMVNYTPGSDPITLPSSPPVELTVDAEHAIA